MGTPTKNSIIGQFINGRSSQDDFLQLATNNGGTVFAWIDYLGHFNGTFAIGAAGPTNAIQFNSGSGVFGGDSTLTYPNVNNNGVKYLYLGDPYSSFPVGITGNDPQVWNIKANIGIIGTGVPQGELTGLQIISYNTAQGAGAVGALINARGSEPDGMFLETQVVLQSGETTSADTIKGLDNEVTVFGTGTVTDIDVIESELHVFDVTATVTSGTHLHIRYNHGSGPITNLTGVHVEPLNQVGGFGYAILIDDQTTNANNYAIYSAGGKNLLAGTSATVALSLPNLIAATSPANQSSPILNLSGNYWDGSASQISSWSIQQIYGTGSSPTDTLTITPTDAAHPTNQKTLHIVTDSLILSSAAGIGSTLLHFTGSSSGSASLTVQSAAGNPSALALPVLDPVGTGALMQATTGNPVAMSWTLTPSGLTSLSAGTLFETTTHTPSSASDTGTTGQIAWDSGFIYVCTATNTWKRVAIAGGF